MQLTGFTVLVVEDDLDNLELLVSYLEEEGAIALGAESLDAALRATQTTDIDALVCDLELPDGNGCALLEQLRKQGDQRNLPAVAITGYSDQHFRRMASACGFNRFVTKPFKLEQITDWLVELIDCASGPVGLSCHAVTEPVARALRGR